MKKQRRKGYAALALLLAAGLCFFGCDKEDLTGDAQTSAPSEESTALEEGAVTESTEITIPSDQTQVAYEEALAHLERGEIEAAYDIFLSIRDYRDVSEYLKHFSYRYGRVLLRGNHSQAVTYYQYNSYGQEIECICENDMTNKAYDEQGRLLYSIDRSGNKESYTYDEKGNLVKKEWYSAKAGRITYCYRYYYDNKAQMTDEYYYCDGVLSNRESYEYDEAGNLIREQWYYFSAENSVTDYTYDETGNLISKTRRTVDGRQYVTQYEYDDRGLLVSEQYGYSAEDIIDKIIMKYDEKGNLIYRKYAYRDNYTQEYTYEYNEAGQRTRKTMAWSSGAYEVETYEYDDNGNVARATLRSYTKNDTVDRYSILEYSEYQLYYNPFSPYEPARLDISDGK